MDADSKRFLEEILTNKTPDTLFNDERDFLRARRAYLTPEQQEKWASVLGDLPVDPITPAEAQQNLAEGGGEKTGTETAPVNAPEAPVAPVDPAPEVPSQPVEPTAPAVDPVNSENSGGQPVVDGANFGDDGSKDPDAAPVQ